MPEFTCQSCGKSFQANDALQQHLQAKHPSSYSPAGSFSFDWKKFKLPIFGLILILIVAGTGFWAFSSSQAPGQYDDFAQCLTESGAKMYGAYWCPHCNNQKELFGNSFKYVKYIECAIQGSNDQALECSSAGVETYPTWEFGDKSRLTGELSLAVLSQKSGCSLK